MAEGDSAAPSELFASGMGAGGSPLVRKPSWTGGEKSTELEMSGISYSDRAGLLNSSGGGVGSDGSSRNGLLPPPVGNQHKPALFTIPSFRRQGGSSEAVSNQEALVQGVKTGDPSALERRSTEVASAAAGDEGPELSWPGALIWITIITVLISCLSQWIVDAIEGASDELHIPMPFLATILLPIVGNAAEHASAIIFAARNRVEVALGVAVGSSTQVSVLLLPFCVILAWMMGLPLDLDFAPFEAVVFFLSILLSIVVLQDGSSNWLRGVVLLIAYFFCAAGFWFHADVDLNQEKHVKG